MWEKAGVPGENLRRHRKNRENMETSHTENPGGLFVCGNIANHHSIVLAFNKCIYLCILPYVIQFMLLCTDPKCQIQ